MVNDCSVSRSTRSESMVAVPRQPQVHEWIDRLKAQSQLVQKSAEELESRLRDTVLSQKLPAPCETQAKDEFQVVGLVEQLRCIFAAMRETEDVLASIHQRIEI